MEQQIDMMVEFGAVKPANPVFLASGTCGYADELADFVDLNALGGFITIGSIFPGQWDWYAFWNLTAFLSIILAIMNVLPIPALDGGHVMFLLYEVISGRKPSDKFLEYAQITGMIILLALLLFANGNDIIRLFKK